MSAYRITVAPPVGLAAKLKRQYFEMPSVPSVLTFIVFLVCETFLKL